MRHFMKQKKDIDQPKDQFRETLIRYLGYSHEIGEAFGKLFLIPKKITNLTYGLTASYVMSDIGHKVAKEHSREQSDSNSILTEAKKQTLWQLFATLILPRIAIHGIAEAAGIILRTNTKIRCRTTQALTALVTLGSIPYIVKPIDNLVDRMVTEHKGIDCNAKQPGCYSTLNVDYLLSSTELPLPQ